MPKGTSGYDFNPDFEDRDEPSGHNFNYTLDISEAKPFAFEPVQAGLYDADVVSITPKVSQKKADGKGGNDMLEWKFSFEITGEDDKSYQRTMMLWDVLIEGQYGKLKAHVNAVDPNYDLHKLNPQTIGDELSGMPCRIRVGPGKTPYEGQIRPEIKEVLPVSTLSFLPTR